MQLLLQPLLTDHIDPLHPFPQLWQHMRLEVARTRAAARKDFVQGDGEAESCKLGEVPLPRLGRVVRHEADALLEEAEVGKRLGDVWCAVRAGQLGAFEKGVRGARSSAAPIS